MKTVLYTRRGCHLCDEAHQLLLEHGITPQLVDIDEDRTLREAYNECVPVVAIDGKVRFRGRIDARLLQRLMKVVSKGDALRSKNEP
ncbi:MAG: glutaredoxin family protein [Planctomycetota bacterium]